MLSDLASGITGEILYVDGGTSTGTTGHLVMEGKEVFRHAIEKLAETAHKALEKAGLSGEDVDWIVPHQANIRLGLGCPALVIAFKGASQVLDIDS